MLKGKGSFLGKFQGLSHVHRPEVKTVLTCITMECACVDCGEVQPSDKAMKLECEAHYICSCCLKKRAVCKPAQLLACTTCSSNSHQLQHATTNGNPAQCDEKPIWIYVDDSNLWIAAKRLASIVNHLKTTEDHRVRIDIGKLTDVVAKHRPVAQGFLYGSEPPPIDTVWEKIRQHQGWNVDCEKRSRITGKEKKIDTKLVADVTERACTIPKEERSTIVLITGDADAIPAMEKVVKYDGWNLEVYMWKHALSSDIKKMDDGDRVRVFALDDCLKQTTFTNMKFNNKEKKLLDKVKSKGVVFKMEKEAFRNRIPTNKWCKQLESIAQWPFQYYWFEKGGKMTDNLVLVFHGNPKEGEIDFDFAHFLEIINNEESPLPFVISAEPFLQFQQKDIGLSQYALEQVGRYTWEEVLSQKLRKGKPSQKKLNPAISTHTVISQL